MSKRCGKNVCVDITVHFLHGDQMRAATISDITPRDMRLHSLVELPFHQEFEFLITFHDKRVMIPVRSGVLIRKDGPCYTTLIELVNPPDEYLEIVDCLSAAFC